MLSLQEQNHELRQATAILAQRLLGEIEAGADLNAIRRIAIFGEPVAEVARAGGGFVELYQTIEHRMDQLDEKLTLKLARAGFGPEERLALLPQIQLRILGSPRIIPIPQAETPALEGGERDASSS